MDRSSGVVDTEEKGNRLGVRGVRCDPQGAKEVETNVLRRRRGSTRASSKSCTTRLDCRKILTSGG